jgi:MoaD family protein
MPTVRIPPVLRPKTGGESEIELAGDTVGAVLEALAAAHPDTRGQLFSGEGDLNRYVNVYLNDEDVRVLDGLDTAVANGDTVVILPAMAGGARSASNPRYAPLPSAYRSGRRCTR